MIDNINATCPMNTLTGAMAKTTPADPAEKKKDVYKTILMNSILKACKAQIQDDNARMKKANDALRKAIH